MPSIFTAFKQYPYGLLISFLKTLGISFLAIATTTITKYYFLAALFCLYSNFPTSKVFKTYDSMHDQFHHVNNTFKPQKIVFANCEKVQHRNVNTALIIKRQLNLCTKTIATWRISIEMCYRNVDFHLSLPKLSTRFDIFLSTIKAEFSLFAYLGESIT